MALSKAEVRSAFREVAMRELSTIPPKENIDHSFSEQFYEKMASLIAEQKRGSWRLLTRQRRRALVVAAILVLSMLLVACTPALRNAVSDFIVSVYERFVDYTPNAELRAEIEIVYGLNPIPEDYEMVSQEMVSPYYVRTKYINSDQSEEIILSQRAGKDAMNSFDSDHTQGMEIAVNELQVTVYKSDVACTILWIEDGYRISIQCSDVLSEQEVEQLIRAVTPQ